MKADYLRVGEYRSTRKGGETIRILHVDRTWGRVQVGYWSGVLRGDKDWLDYTRCLRKYPVIVPQPSECRSGEVIPEEVLK